MRRLRTAWAQTPVERSRYLVEGVRKDGSRLKPPMGFAWYTRMGDADLDAIVAYLRTVPPKE